LQTLVVRIGVEARPPYSLQQMPLVLLLLQQQHANQNQVTSSPLPSFDSNQPIPIPSQNLSLTHPEHSNYDSIMGIIFRDYINYYHP